MSTEHIFDVANRKQLFIDHRFITQQYGIELVVNPPVKSDIILACKEPWELNRLGCYSTVIQHDGIYKLWYDGYAIGAPNCPEALRRNLCYATSPDGLNWQREPVNLYNWCDNRENNIVMPGGTASVMLDPKAPDEHRFKALGIAFENNIWPESQGCKWDLTGGALHLWTSPEGINWKRVKPFASPFFHDSYNHIFYDDRIGTYVAYIRTHETHARTVSRVELDNPMRTPWPYRAVPDDTKPNEHGQYLGMTHGGYDMVMACDSLDPTDTDVQQANCLKYPYAQDVYLADEVLYRHYPESVEGEFKNDGPNDSYLAVSRDGIDWTRPQRKPYIPLGIVGEWDGGCIWPVHGMIRKDAEIWQYYCGTWHTHGNYDPSTKGVGGLRRTVQRLDGFVSADAAYTGAEFVTPFMKFSGSGLELNVDCSAMGQVWVEVQDEKLKAVDGFSLEDAVPVDRNQTAAKVNWKNSPSLAQLQERPIRLRFKLNACKLYAFQFVD